MVIGLHSDVVAEGVTNLVQTGGNSGDTNAEVNNSESTTVINPESSIHLDLANSDNVALQLDTHAVGWEQVVTAVEQEAEVASGQPSGSGGWGAATSGGWGASLGN